MAQRKWPPQCCVPAFVDAALTQLGVSVAIPERIARELDVRVRYDQENPFALALADTANPEGISGPDAEFKVNKMCQRMSLPFRLRRIPFKTIYGDLWEELLNLALSREVVAGLGLNYRKLFGTSEPSRSAQHILRVLAYDADCLALFDDSGESDPPNMRFKRDQVADAVLTVPDGLWLVGRSPDLSFPLTLPWRDLA